MNAIRHWPFFAALAVFAALFMWVFSSAAQFTSGQLVYALDDPYIHMAIGRSLAEHGVWGLDGAHFAGASSSLLWPLLVAMLFLVQGANDFAPLVLNVLAALGLLAISHAFLVRRGVKGPVIFLVLLLLIVATPLVPLSMTGIEHVLHAFLAVAFAVLFSEVLAAPADRRWPPFLVLAALFLGAVRYEGLFEVGLAALGLCAYRRRGLAVLILAVAVEDRQFKVPFESTPRAGDARERRAPAVVSRALNLPRPATFSHGTPPRLQRGPAGLPPATRLPTGRAAWSPAGGARSAPARAQAGEGAPWLEPRTDAQRTTRRKSRYTFDINRARRILPKQPDLHSAPTLVSGPGDNSPAELSLQM